MVVRRFEELTVWQRSRELSLAVYRVSAGGAFARDRALRDQIRRASVSVMSNIAEGFERFSRSEFRHFLAIARGSASEVRSQLHLAHDLRYLSDAEHRTLHALCVDVSRMLARLRSRLESQPHRR